MSLVISPEDVVFRPRPLSYGRPENKILTLYDFKQPNGYLDALSLKEFGVDAEELEKLVPPQKAALLSKALEEHHIPKNILVLYDFSAGIRYFLGPESLEKIGIQPEVFKNMTPIERAAAYVKKTYKRNELLGNKEYVALVLDNMNSHDSVRAVYHQNLRSELAANNVAVGALRFVGKVKDGIHKGKYKVIMLGFDGDGKFVETAEAVVDAAGYVRVFGRNSLPYETTKERGPVETVAGNVEARWRVGREPKVGEIRLLVYDTKSESPANVKLLNLNSENKINQGYNDVGLLIHENLDVECAVVASNEAIDMLKLIQKTMPNPFDPEDIYERTRFSEEFGEVGRKASVALSKIEKTMNAK